MELEKFMEISEQLQTGVNEENIKFLYHILKKDEIWGQIKDDPSAVADVLAIIKVVFRNPDIIRIYLKQKVRKKDRTKFVETAELGKIERYIYNRFYNTYMKDKKGFVYISDLENEIISFYKIQQDSFRRYYSDKIYKIKNMAVQAAKRDLKERKKRE